MKFVHLFEKEGNKICANLLKFNKNADPRHEAKLPIQILHLLTQVQVFKKSLDFRVFHIIFYYFNGLVPQIK